MVMPRWGDVFASKSSLMVDVPGGDAKFLPVRWLIVFTPIEV